MTADKFEFIVSNGPKLQNDPKIRTLIRQRAMKDVAIARRQRGNYGRINLRQLPESASLSPSDQQATRPTRIAVQRNPDTSISEVVDLTTDYDDSESASCITVVSQQGMSMGSSAVVEYEMNTPFDIPTTIYGCGYEATCARYGVNVTDLSMLTTFNVGRATNQLLASDPSRLLTLLGHSRSYLHFVPSYYGTSDCLTAATDCVLAKARSVLMPNKADSRLELKLYVRALQTLQNALGDASACLSSDVLCATQLISLHELLESAHDKAWVHHLHGSIRLVRFRTSKRFTTEFEKSLFVAHIGPVITDALVGDKRCYLEDPEWIELYKTVIKYSSRLTERSPLAIALRTQMFILPGVWHDVQRVMSGSELFDDDSLIALAARCKGIHDGLLEFMEGYKTYCVKSSLILPSPQELAVRRELLGSAYECIAVVKRLWATVDDPERPRLEEEAQVVAQSLLGLQKEVSVAHSWLFAGHEIGIAGTVIASREQWEGSFEFKSDYERKLASWTRYISWSNSIRGV